MTKSQTTLPRLTFLGNFRSISEGFQEVSEALQRVVKISVTVYEVTRGSWGFKDFQERSRGVSGGFEGFLGCSRGLGGVPGNSRYVSGSSSTFQEHS